MERICHNQIDERFSFVRKGGKSMSYKVLVLIKPGDVQPAMERASEFARFMPDLEVVACRVVNDYEQGQEDKLEQTYLGELNKLFQRYPSITHGRGKVLFAKDVPAAFCKYSGDEVEAFDLAIISANRRNTLKDLFVAPVDSQVMRRVAVPLLVVKDPHAPQRLGKAILLAIDFEEEDHNSVIDEVLVTSAKVFADHFNGEVHVVNCVPPLHRGLMSGNTSSSMILGGGKKITRTDLHAAALLDFAKAHDISEDHCHIAEGRVDEMIPKVSSALEARMVCMGTSSNKGILGAIDPSAGELVLEQIRGDIFIVNKHVNISKMQVKSVGE